MPGNTLHLMPDGEILEYMQDLIAGRHPPNLFANQPLDADDFPILIQIPKYNLLTRALQANIDLEDFAAGLAALVADGTIQETDAAYLIALAYVPPDGRDRHQ